MGQFSLVNNFTLDRAAIERIIKAEIRRDTGREVLELKFDIITNPYPSRIKSVEVTLGAPVKQLGPQTFIPKGAEAGNGEPLDGSAPGPSYVNPDHPMRGGFA